MKLAGLSIFVVAIFLIVGCEKDYYPIANGKLLQKIVYRWHDTLYYSFLKYDQNDRLVEIKGTGINSPLDTIIVSINYDAQGKMIGYIYKYNRFPNVYAYTFIYNSDGRISEKRTPGSNTRSHIYAYDQKGRLVADSLYIHDLNSMIPVVLYEYDDADNLIKWQNFYYNPATRKIDSLPRNEASYHNSRNTLADIAQTLHFILEYRAYILSKHNVAQVKNNGDTHTYTYEYYANGLTKKVIHNNDKAFYEEFFYD